MKLVILMIVIMLGFLQACTEEESASTLNVYYMNDLHGALKASDTSMGMAAIGHYLQDEKANNPDNTLILGGGDMLQGTLLSNADYGKTTTRIMDYAGFDATVVGNHEFDWGLEKVTRYYNGTHDYEASHAFLASNIFYEGTSTIPEGIDPYAVFERAGITIGVVGAIGYKQESSIMAAHAKDYVFEDPVPHVRTHARTLREDYDADMVLFVSHDGMDTIRDTNARLATLQDESRIDGIFYGHSHRTNATMLNDTPALISGASGSHLGRMTFDLEDGQVTDVRMDNLRRHDDAGFYHEARDIADLIQERRASMSHYYEQSLLSDASYQQGALTQWMSELMREASGADFGVQNSGGTRDSFYAGERISPARLYDVFPFDNTIVTSDVSGAQARHILESNAHHATSKPLDDIDPSGTYTVATNAYVFYSPYNSLTEGENIQKSTQTLFDLAHKKFEYLHESKDTFTVRENPSIDVLDAFSD